jgi:hypothetical protein
MADNYQTNSGSGGNTYASDDISSVHYPRVKISWGVDGSAVDASATNPFPVVQTGALPAGTNNIGDVDVLSLPAIPAGTNNIGDVDVLTVPSDPFGANADAASATGSISAKLRYLASSGLAGMTALPAGNNNIGDVDIASIAAGDNNIGNVDVVTLPALPAGTNNIGDVDVLTVPSDPFGANADAASATGSISAKLRYLAASGIAGMTALPAGTNNIGDVDIVTMPNVTLAAGTNTNEVVGDVAHDAAIAGNPVRIGARAVSADITAVATGDMCDFVLSLLGKQVQIPYALPGLSWSYAAASGGITNTTGVTAKTAAGAGIRNYVTRAQVINGHASTDTDVQIRDGASGTVLWRAFAKAGGGGVSAKFDPPLRGTANTLIEVACGTTGAAVYVNLQGFAAAE